MTGGVFSCVFPGEPCPAPRPRVARGRAYYPSWYTTWKKQAAWRVKAACRGAPPMDGAVQAVLEHVFQLPASYPKWQAGQVKSTKPDLDNLTKAILDACEAGGALTNDSRIYQTMALKRWAKPGEQPHSVIRMFEVA